MGFRESISLFLGGDRKFVRFLITLFTILLIIYLFGRDFAPGFFETFDVFVDNPLGGTPFAIKHLIFISSLYILWQLRKDELI